MERGDGAPPSLNGVPPSLNPPPRDLIPPPREFIVVAREEDRLVPRDMELDRYQIPQVLPPSTKIKI